MNFVLPNQGPFCITIIQKELKILTPERSGFVQLNESSGVGCWGKEHISKSTMPPKTPSHKVSPWISWQGYMSPVVCRHERTNLQFETVPDHQLGTQINKAWATMSPSALIILCFHPKPWKSFIVIRALTLHCTNICYHWVIEAGDITRQMNAMLLLGWLTKKKQSSKRIRKKTNDKYKQ